MDMISSLTSDVVNKALDGLIARQKAIGSNLANVDTPNYKRKDVSFEGALSAALGKTRGAMAEQADNSKPLAMKGSQPGHIAIGQVANSVTDVSPEETEADSDEAFRNDGNSVDLESEMAKLARNTQQYTALSNIEARRLRSIKSILNGPQ